MKTKLAVCVTEINLHCIFGEEEFDGPEYGVLNFAILQVMSFQYFSFDLCVFK